MGVPIGKRDANAAQALWNSLPKEYQEKAMSFTNFWEAYQLVFPEDRHIAVSKETGKTNHIERFNNTLRQRVSRLFRKTLSFSKNWKTISVLSGISFIITMLHCKYKNFIYIAGLPQSTHPRRMRQKSYLLSQSRFVSIHAPAKGATSHTVVDWYALHVSIHAPAKGATARCGRPY